MKIIILFLFILIIGTSIKKEDYIQPCSKQLLIKYYHNHRLIAKDTFNDGNFWVARLRFSKEATGYDCDSLSVDIFAPSIIKRKK